MKPSRRKRKLARFRARNAQRLFLRKILRTGYLFHHFGVNFYSADEMEPAWRRITGITGDLERRFVQPTHTRSILLRMLNNLKNILVAMDEPGPLSTLATLRGAFPELAQERAEHARWLRHWN